MAAHSVTTVSPCRMAGTLPIGLMARYSAAFIPVPKPSSSVRYGRPTSSSIQRATRPRDMGWVNKVISSVMRPSGLGARILRGDSASATLGTAAAAPGTNTDGGAVADAAPASDGRCDRLEAHGARPPSEFGL